MKAPIDITLTGSDSPVEGLARQITYPGYDKVFEFQSTDETLHLIIAHTDGHWIRLGGTDPYLSGWVDELAEQVSGKAA